MRYVDGVVMAGDRRATEGFSIAHRAIEKVFPADRHSGVSIAGAAGPAIEMVKLFQLQLEHYEKLNGSALSLEGKANQLSQMIRSNLPMAMQGLAVVPIFAGFDLRRADRSHLHLRRHRRPLRGGRLPRHRLRRARRAHHDQARLAGGHGPRARPSSLAVQGLYEAAEEDAATGGPDPVRGIYPTVATITAEGFERVPEERGRRALPGADPPQDRSRAITAMSMPFYVSPEQFMKDKADYAIKNIARGRPLVAVVFGDGILLAAENPSTNLHKISEIYDRIAFGGVGRYSEFDQLRQAGHPARRHQGLPVQPRGRRRPLARQPLRPVPQPGLHPRDEAVRGRDPRRRGRDARSRTTGCSTSSTTATWPTRTTSSSWARTPTRSPNA